MVCINNKIIIVYLYRWTSLQVNYIILYYTIIIHRKTAVSNDHRGSNNNTCRRRRRCSLRHSITSLPTESFPTSRRRPNAYYTITDTHTLTYDRFRPIDQQVVVRLTIRLCVCRALGWFPDPVACRTGNSTPTPWTGLKQSINTPRRVVQKNKYIKPNVILYDSR